MKQNDIIIYDAHWCPDCRQTRLFLDEHKNPFQWMDIEKNPEAEQFVIEKKQRQPNQSHLYFSRQHVFG